MKSNSNYWELRYREGVTGWDIGEISPPLRAYIDQLEDKNLKILIPGGGNSYEAEYLFYRGFRNVFVNDIARQPLENFIKRVPSFPVSNLLQEDFFGIDQKFDLIIEQTFFCALQIEQRKAYVEKIHEILLPGGKLTGVLFNTQFEKEGPPFGGSRADYISLFQEKFLIKTLEDCYNSITPRQGNELFFIFIKKLENMPKANIILNSEQIQNKIRRIAFQIYESNVDESQLILAGITKSGYHFAQKLKKVLEEISDLEILLCEVKVDKKNPLNPVLTSLKSSDYTNKSIVLIDDVLNSGATLIYGVKHFLDVPLKRFKTAVLVDRSHKKFPVKADFKGISLSTSLSERVEVHFAEGKDRVELL